MKVIRFAQNINKKIESNQLRIIIFISLILVLEILSKLPYANTLLTPANMLWITSAILLFIFRLSTRFFFLVPIVFLLAGIVFILIGMSAENIGIAVYVLLLIGIIKSVFAYMREENV